MTVIVRPVTTQKGVLTVREMTSKRVAIIIAILLAFGSRGNCIANQAGFSLEQITKKADVVISGVVLEVSANPVIESGGIKVVGVSFKIDECFKMTNGPIIQSGSVFQLLNTIGGPELPTLRKGSRYILFLEQSEVGPSPVGPLSGVVPIVGESAKTAYLVGEPASMSMNSLTGRLRKSTKRFGCDDKWGDSSDN
ncbi:MAG: hypothetical protein R3C97_00245 [Geminicoccaceae bacterium]|nr:hypothetical protein [Dokdonella sp.]